MIAQQVRNHAAAVALLLTSITPLRAGQPPQSPAAVRSQLEDELKRQRERIAELERTVRQQGLLLEKLQSRMGELPSPQLGVSAAASPNINSLGEVASMAAVIPSTANSAPPSVLPRVQKEENPEPSPLSIRIGTAYITPVGFLDFTAVIRDTTTGNGIGTNFGNFPYRTSANVPGNLSEFRFSPQNSRLGMRVDAQVKGAKVLAYWESDFLGGTGNQSVGNVAVSSNSYPFRLRLYWVDVRRGKFEFLGGQTWSLATPGRSGISPLPGDLFYTQDIDVNYQLGLVWGRIPEFRMVYHPSQKVTMALALDSPEQYIGGSAGAGQIVLPTNLVTPYGSQLNNGTTTLGVPNLHPDIIAKIAFDPTLPNGHAFHFELGGLGRTFKTYNPLTTQEFTAHGWGVQANLNLELVRGFRAVTNNYWSDGGGRYIFGQAPDLVVDNDGSLSPVHSGSTVSGFEYTNKNLLLYTYYSGAYIQRNVIAAPGNGDLVGYGFSGSANSQNRFVQEGTVGFTNTFWKDANYGALSLMAQYSYLTRAPWFVAPGTPGSTHMNVIFLNLRYALPGSAPTIK